MPIYMDRHDVSEIVTAENVAELHSQDLKIQHKFNCRGLTYWFDEKRKTAFCLIEAPNEKAIKDMHEQAHGEVPHRVIEVDPNLVESFLGRIEDPKKTKNTKLNVINDPAFRAIMIIELSKQNLIRFNSARQNGFKSSYSIIDIYEGRIINHKNTYLLVSFKSVSKAVECALKIQSKVKKHDSSNARLKITISGGVPVTDENILFEKAINKAKKMCEVNKANTIITSEIKGLFKDEKLIFSSKNKHIYTLSLSEESFLDKLLNFTEQNLNNENLKADDFNKQLGYSKSQLYRKMIDLIGKSPNTFLKEYRLKRTLELLDKSERTISEVSFLVGFRSPSYFSKCFQENYLISPTDFIKMNKS